ncbi:MAG: hypothetical protein ACLTYW_09675 [Collinsella sp.]
MPSKHRLRRRICDMTARFRQISRCPGRGLRCRLTAPLAIETGEDGRVNGARAAADYRRASPRSSSSACRRHARARHSLRARVCGPWPGHRFKPFEDMGIACKGVASSPIRTAPCPTDGLFSGGDCQTGPATVIRAINAGRVASASTATWVSTTRSARG